MAMASLDAAHEMFCEKIRDNTPDIANFDQVYCEQ